MGNHYHLLVSTPNGNLQRAMRHLGGVYTQFYNRSNGTDGALFRGRYKAILVDSDESNNGVRSCLLPSVVLSFLNECLAKH